MITLHSIFFFSTGKCCQILLAFSVYTNARKVLTTTQSPGSISCIHGIRFLSMNWVILGHMFAFGVTDISRFRLFLLLLMLPSLLLLLMLSPLLLLLLSLSFFSLLILVQLLAHGHLLDGVYTD